MNDLMQCKICGEYFNPACLSEVFEHEHKGVSTDKEYFGSKVEKIEEVIKKGEEINKKEQIGYEYN